MAELVRDHDGDLAGREVVHEGVPEHDAPARAEARRLGVRQRRDVVHVLDDDRDVAHVLDPLEPRRRGAQLRVAQAVRRQEIRIDEREQQREPDEHRRRGRPPEPGQLAGEAHDDREGEAEEDELPAEREPVAEDLREVADMREVVPPLPPEIRDVERELRRPDEGEAEHAEQHPGAQRSRRRLAREAPALARVHRERDELGERREHPVDDREAAEDAVARSCAAEKYRCSSRCGSRSDGNDARAPQQPGRRSPGGSEQREQRRPRGCAAGHAGSSNESCAGAAPSSGLACGYASVMRNTYALSCDP